MGYCALHALKQAGAAVSLDLLAASGKLSPCICSPLSPLPLPSPLLVLSSQPLC